MPETSSDVNQGFTDAADSEPLGITSADDEKPKANIPKSSSVDIPISVAGSSSAKTSSGFDGKVRNNAACFLLDL